MKRTSDTEPEGTQTVFARVPSEVHEWLLVEARREAERSGRRESTGAVVRMLLVHAYRAATKKPNGKRGK